jgi:polyketide synthase PksJ
MREFKKLDKGNIEDIIALTPIQEGILFHYLKEPETGAYHEQLNLELVGNTDIRCFEAAWNFVIETNEMLRTVFRWENMADPVQVVLKNYKLQKQYFDISSEDRTERKKLLEEIKRKDRDKKFNLEDVAFRVTLGKVDTNRYEMIISNHHILYDGWSNGIILGEFLEAYNNLLMGNPLKPQLKTKFKEFVKGMQKQDLKKQEKFWTNYLKDFTLSTGLSLKNKIKDRDPDKPAGTYSTNIPSPIKDDLHRFVKEVNITPASLLYSALGILLQRYNNCDDVILGTTVSGRSAKIKGIENMVGLFINTLPLRIQTLANERAIDLIYRIQEILAQREEYERTSLVDIKEYSELGNGNRGELFDVIVAVENYLLPKRIFQQNDHRPLTINSYSLVETTHYDLYIGIIAADDMVVSANYSKDYFNGTLIENMVNHFIRIVHCILQNPGIEIHQIELLSEEEKTHMIYNLNATCGDYPQNRTIYELFEEQAAKTPGQAAVVFGNEYLTYSELNQRSHQLAGRLRDKGIRPGINVGLMVEASAELLIGLAAVLKAGGTYVPIDTAYPDRRIKSILRESAIGILLVNSQRGRIFDEYELIDLTGVKNHKNHNNNPPPLWPLSHSRDLAYIIFTSGTTAEPKGVMIEHRSIINFIEGVTAKIPFVPGESLLSLTSISFDIFVLETLLPLTKGLKVVMGGREERLNPDETAKAIKKHNITILQVTPSRLQLLSEGNAAAALSNLAYLIVGGEAFPAWLLEKIRPLTTGRIYNMYGPTETTVWSSLKNVTAGSLDIGKPFLNTRIYILGKEDMLQPVGVPGELCIAGHGLARGYLNKPELTHERFRESEVKVQGEAHELHELPRIEAPSNEKLLRGVQGAPWHGGPIRDGFVAEDVFDNSTCTCNLHLSPLAEKPPPGRRSQKLYRTGDLARWLLDGNIEFLCRIDHQIKIRGYRIEPGEIQHKLVNYRGIKDAVVIAKESPAKSNYLCAFIVSEHEINLSELRRYLNASLPDYMIPGEFIRLEKIPVNSNGKVDRKALQSNRQPGARLETPVSYTAPGSEMEKIIADTWKEVLQREKVGIHDNFFDIGGNSFSIIRLNSRLKEAFNKDIPMTDLFKYPTVASLAHHLSRGEKQGENHFDHIETGEVKEFAVGRKEIAVIGMASRFPGAKNIDEFWENLKNGVESIWFFSDNELELSGAAQDHKNNPGYVKAKGVLEGIEFFDASFFEYTMSQAELMDPQIRIFHECCWNALENAGYDPHAYKGLIGLYAGAAPNPGWEAQSLLIGLEAHHFLEQWEALQFRDKDYLSTRVSYKLNLKGPVVTVQTACSTSLAAIDMACQGLLTARCDIALAGGVSITFHDQTGYLYQEGMIMSRDGHCRAFDERATGTVNGNGAAVVVLKPLKEAAADRDFIYAVIKGSAVNNDGTRKVGFTAPSIEGQAEAIGAAHRIAGVEAESISYLETHGTGTILGDPIEIEGLKLAFESFDLNNPNKKNYCAIGSVKTNIGHLDAAAGIAGLIKTVLVLHHRVIPPSLNFERPNPGNDLENSPFYVNTTLKEWKNNEYPLRAGISSFGIGGTNVHVILEEAPAETRDKEGTRGLVPLINAETSKEYQIILLSAKSESALEKMTGNLVQHFKNNPGIDLADAAYTLQVGRKAFQYRRASICSNVKGAIKALSPAHFNGSTPSGDLFVVFMFPGLGAQYVNMGRDLYENQPIFRQTMDRCFEILKSLMDDDIKGILYPSFMSNRSYMSNINQTEVTQVVVFIFEYALAQQLIYWGIKPHALIGYSFGEYAAACTAGVFSPEHALKLVAARGQLIQTVPPGAMLSIPLSREELTPLLPHDISLAIDNGHSCIAAGSAEAVAAFADRMKQEGLMCMQVPNSHAFHSKMMEPILSPFREIIAGLKLNRPHTPYISNVTGDWITPEQAVDPGYWVNHLSCTVRFTDGIKKLLKTPDLLLVEVGPGRDISTLVKRHLENQEENESKDKQKNHQVLNLIAPAHYQEDPTFYLLKRIGQLWEYGTAVDWLAFHKKQKRRRVPLPTYPFKGKRFQVSPLPLNPDKIAGPRENRLVKRTDIAEWFYIPHWKRCTPEQPPGTHSLSISGIAKNWLVLTNGSSTGSCLVMQLNRQGQRVVTVKPGARFKRESHHEYALRPGEESHYRDLFRELARDNCMPHYIVHLWTISPDPPGDHRVVQLKTIDNHLEKGFYSLIYLVKSLKGSGPVQDISLGVVSNHVHEVIGGEGLNPAKAAILGPLKVISQEYPFIHCCSIDVMLPESGSPGEEKLCRQLVWELTGKRHDKVIAYRGDYRWVLFFQPLRWEAPPHQSTSTVPVPRLRQGGVYLVTGGLGNIGSLLATYLAETLKARLILIGRTPLPPRDEWKRWLETHPGDNGISKKIKRVMAMERKGGQVLVFAVDISVEKGMHAVVTRAEKRLGPINGVIHAAGELGQSMVCPIEGLEQSDCQLQFNAKIYGLMVLQRVLENRQLDFCLLTSSLSPLLGGLGLAAYSAANSFMDAFVYWYNRKAPGRWTSINWADWRFPGQRHQDQGAFGTVAASAAELHMNPTEGVQTFLRILYHNENSQVTVSTGDLDTRLRQWVELEPLHQDDENKNKNKAQRSAASLTYSRPDNLGSYVPPRDRLEQEIAQTWQEIFKIEPVGIRDDFFEMGGDSLKAINAISRMHQRVRLLFTLEEFFKRPTIEQLADYHQNKEKVRYTSIEPSEKKDYYALSSAQKRLFILYQINPGNLAYNITSMMTLEVEVKKYKFEGIFQKIINRHESLRTFFLVINEKPVQRIQDELEFNIEYYDLASNNQYMDPGNRKQAIINGFIRSFDFSQAPLLRVELIKTGENTHIFMADIHHIISDGISMTILIKEFLALFNGDILPGMKIQYKDYSQWQNQLVESGEMSKQENYWLKQFEGEIPVLNMLTDYKRPEKARFEGEIVYFEVGKELTDRLKEITRNTQTTLYIIFLTVYTILLSKYTGQDDIVVGSGIAGRNHADLENIIGMFINMIVMRNQPGENKTFGKFLEEVKESTLKAFENQDYPFDELVKKLGLQGHWNRNPLFDTQFTFQNMPQEPGKISGLTFKPYQSPKKPIQFDLSLNGVESGETITMVLTYWRHIFKRETIEKMANHFIEILEQSLENIEIKIGNITLSHELIAGKSDFSKNDSMNFGF